MVGTMRATVRVVAIPCQCRTITRPIGAALVNFEGRELPVPVVLGEKDDDALLGVTTLESFGLMLDPFKRQIYPSKLMLG